MSLFVKKDVSNSDVNVDKINKTKSKSEIASDKNLKIIISWLKPVIVIAVIFVFVNLIGKIITAPGAATVKEQNEKLISLKNSYDIQYNQFKDKQSQDAAIEDCAYYTGDTSADDAIAEAFFSHICTWSNAATYEFLRKEMKAAGYTDSDSVMLALLPEETMIYDNETHDMHYSVDTNGENMRYVSLNSYPISVNGTRHEYAGILKVASTDRTNGSRENFGYVYVNYVIMDNQCLEVSAESLIEQ